MQFTQQWKGGLAQAGVQCMQWECWPWQVDEGSSLSCSCTCDRNFGMTDMDITTEHYWRRRGSATILHSPPEFFPQIFWTTVLLFFCLLLHVVCLCWILKLLQLWTQLFFHLVSKVLSLHADKRWRKAVPCMHDKQWYCLRSHMTSLLWYRKEVKSWTHTCRAISEPCTCSQCYNSWVTIVSCPTGYNLRKIRLVK